LWGAAPCRCGNLIAQPSDAAKQLGVADQSTIIVRAAMTVTNAMADTISHGLTQDVDMPV